MTIRFRCITLITIFCREINVSISKEKDYTATGYDLSDKKKKIKAY